MDWPQTPEPAASAPFLLHPSSPEFLAGDARGIRERFQFRRDVLDYLAMAAVLAGGLLLMVKIAQMVNGTGLGDELHATISALGLAALLIAGGAWYVTSRHGAAASRLRMIDAGRILPGIMISCTARHETSAEAAIGEVTRIHIVTVEYRFATPDGQELTGHDDHDRPDLRRLELPEAGTPVRVLYLDDATYALL